MTTTPCPFCDRINRGEYLDGAGGVVWFEPLNPVTPGHMLFVPTIHATSAAADPQGAAQTMKAAALYVLGLGYAANIITSIGAPATQTVHHTHLHVVPRRDGDGLALPWTGQKPPPCPAEQCDDCAHIEVDTLDAERVAQIEAQQKGHR